MIDANSQFFAILTNVGLAKQANADALGIPWKITDMGLGDANLAGVADPPNPVPSPAQTKLINEWRRRPLNQLKIDPANPAIIIAEQIIPADEGGRWIREIGLYDEAGDLVAVANCAPSYKPLLSQGSGRTQVVRMNFIVSNAGNITLKIDPAVVLASRAYVDAAILEVLPKNKTPGEWTRVKTNDRGVVVSGDNPSTLAEMGITDTYTKTQIEAMIAQASALPVGTQVSFPVNKVPPGFLERDGSAKSIALYPDLATFLGGAFNRGDEGAGNFRLPDSRGEFERGWDHGRGADPDRAVGSAQAASFLYEAVGQLNSPGRIATAVQNEDLAARVTRELTVYQPASTQNSTAYVDTGRAVRPRNIAVVMCIKAWNAPINQGNIDIAALVAIVERLQINGPIAGGASGLRASVPVASATATFVADSVMVEDVNGKSYRLKNFSKPINLASAVKGLGAMDVGAAPDNGYVAVYALFNPDTGLQGAVAVNATASVAPNLCAGVLPAGYTASGLISVWPTNASGQFKYGHQVGRDLSFTAIVGISTNVSAVNTVLPIAGAVPLNAKTVSGSLIGLVSVGSGNVITTVASDANGLGVQEVAGYSQNSYSVKGVFRDLFLITPQTIYYGANGITGGGYNWQVHVTGYSF